jgi:hypothetical protein
LQLNRDSSLTDVALTITHCLRKIWLPLMMLRKSSGPFCEVYIYTRLKREKGANSGGAAVSGGGAEVLKEFSNLEDAGDG